MKYGLAVGLAGSVGALLRYEAGLWTHAWWHSAFPLATLAINLTGCLALGWFTAWAAMRPGLPESLRLGIGTGLIGAYTTFSTFSVETLALLRDGRAGHAALYVGASLIGGLLFAWGGFRLGERRKSVKKREVAGP
ncbi:fluoride efflux transporter CrcB [Cohnella rhizosphaerae]|uniref:Fluoride-specific ion channel FluC n=1 Tax=Cohnella rhizosphaerae TaxID=1457232 RepID=A0A9X4QVJ6_9BACL|nr:fluoride efflux transporter CrcB [Cohnella rhizosphaerae]MDG0813401.1 fluoride efflux transporter CrcB [Cohnella rhizosphaerae]